MSSVRARVWRFTVEKGASGAEAVDAVEIGQGPLPVSLAALVNINALACDLRKNVDQRVRDHEISLLLSYIGGSTHGSQPLGVDCAALDSSSGHIKRFVSECTGLGVMTAASESLFNWAPGTDDLSSFDVLPAKLAGIYAKTGVRPDLLYDLAAGPLAGEARGRRRNHKKMFPAGKGTPEQRARLERLAQWSVDHDDHAYFMSWVWLGAGGVYVDIFLPDGSPAADSLKTGWIDTPGSALPWKFHIPRPVPRRRPEVVNPEDLRVAMAHTVETDHAVATSPPEGQVRQALSRAEPLVEAAMDRSFGREEETLGTVSDVPVRGRWIRSDAVGQARHEVLLGILGERVPVDHRAQRNRWSSQTSDRLDLFLEGRLLTVVHPVGSPRPSWDRIRTELLGG
ncbi:hypothetical protein ABZ128_03690 [Streptomyces sp. NPDC006326]|uniref:hypothetical protein n=1 Tax=Streptomyces sp. NPDC006326 TaxID=3156752 RepID=UPI0033BAFDDB